MLEALVIAGLVAAPLGSAALFLPARHHERAGVWAAIWRVILVITGSVVFAAAAAGVLYLLKATEANLVIGAAGVALAGLLWLPVTRNWSPRAHLCWAFPPTSSGSTWCTRWSGPSPAILVRLARPAACCSGALR